MRHNDKKTDQLLRQSLHAIDTEAGPSLQLQIKTMEKMKERYEMLDSTKRSIGKSVCTALLAGSLLIGVPVGAFAAWQLLSPAQVATELQDFSLAKAFQNKDAIIINQVEKAGDYQFTLLGLVSGASCSDFVSSDVGINQERMYAAIAIQRQDGKPMPSTDSADYGKDTFVVSPLIQGELPWQVNIFTMGGGYAEFVQDGIQYRLVECDDVMPFADRNVWLSVTDGTINNQMFVVDEKTGNISENQYYKGINLLFQLPLDTNKADSVKAEQLLQQWAGGNTDENSSEGDAEQQEFEQRYAKIVAEGKVKPDSVCPLTQDKTGIWWYQSPDGSQVSISAEEAATIEKGSTYNGVMTMSGSDTEWMIVQFGRDEKGVLYGQELVLPR